MILHPGWVGPVGALPGASPADPPLATPPWRMGPLPLALRLMTVGNRDRSRHGWAPNHRGAELEEKV